MAFVFSETNIRDNQIVFIYEECAYSGVRKIAGRVRADIEKVFGAKPIGVECADFADTAAFYSYPVFFGTVGKSNILDELASQGSIDLFAIAGEKEVYSLTVVDDLKFRGFSFESAIVIAGSDKRGTIYGLFALSELLGVSAFVDWLDIKSAKLSEYTLNVSDSITSRTPSVKYRGFFINDEWPAFGNRSKALYGGFNAKMYSHVFELLLRLRGNYIWPAMWSSLFYDDGPDDASAKLADELGIIMGTSHHEPCMRQGEEYGRLRGSDSPYGDAWDFRTNREGIIKFWQDSLSDRSRFENIVTVGMRGEADSPILPGGSGLSENVALLRDVLAVQNRIIEECYGRDVNEVPRVFALYKEVEPYYYGDAKTPGLKDDPALDGVTILLCDDNFGNLRSVPTEEERDRRGGYGMYYHFDYHGEPVSYEWFNTSYLPKIWEQMTSAYDNGIRDMWIVNVGDIFSNEYPLAFFMDLAYDFDRWGTSDKNSAANYTKEFVKRALPLLDDRQKELAEELLLGYTRITYCRRTEAMNESVYSPLCESDEMLHKIDDLMGRARKLYKSLEADAAFAFYEIVYLPLTAVLNVQKMWILTGKNHEYARIGSTVANTLAGMIRECIDKDRKLTKKLHELHGGKWYGMGLSEHIGFKHWCEEECAYPVVHTFEPAAKPRLIVRIPSTGEYTEGGFWTGKDLILPDPADGAGYIELSVASSEKVSYTVSTEDEFIKIDDPGKSVKCGQIQMISVSVDRSKLPETSADPKGCVSVCWNDRKVRIIVPVKNRKLYGDVPENTYIPGSDGCVCIEAEHFAEKKDTNSGSFEVIEGYGRTTSAVKAYPQESEFTLTDAPSVKYRFMTDEAGSYVIRLFTSPANPHHTHAGVEFGLSVNAKESVKADMIPEGYEVSGKNADWEKGVLDNIRIKDIKADMKKGLNEITISALTPGFVLERIVIMPEDHKDVYSYLGPSESICIKG